MRVLLLSLCSVVALSAPSLANTFLVGNKFEGTVSFIDLDSGQETKRVETGGSPHEIAMSPDGKTAVVVSYMHEGFVGEELNVFDVESAALKNTISTAPHLAPHGIGWIGDTRDVIVTTEETRDVIRVNLDEERVTGTAATDQIGSHLLALSPDTTLVIRDQSRFRHDQCGRCRHHGSHEHNRRRQWSGSGRCQP